MQRIMILGIGPLAIEPTQKFHGGGNRAWHFTKPLLDAGMEVLLIGMRITGNQNHDEPLETLLQDGKLTYYSVDEIHRFADDAWLKEKIGQFQPDALIGACDYPAARAAIIAGEIPVWADIHGYPMGEAQAKSFHYQEAGYLHHFWNIHRIALLRGDRFSVTSERQRMAVIGELGVMGRLNQHTFGEELTYTIPIAWDPKTHFSLHERTQHDPLIVFFSGGYNLWCDVETLFKALEIAMQSDPRIHFLSTGGAIEGHDDKSYPRFEAMVRQSPFRDRFELRGWVSKEELDACMRRAHLGISVDLPCYESRIGARNRLTEFMARGIPILTTLNTEISQILFYKGLAFTVPMQNPSALANEILLAADHPEKTEKMALEAHEYFASQFTYEVTTRDLVTWCKNPCHSGDFGYPVPLDYRNPFLTKVSQESIQQSPGLRARIQKMLGF